MLSLPFVVLTSFALVAPLASAQPTQPEVLPQMSLNYAILETRLPITPNHWVENWADTHILQWCKEMTIRYGYNPQDMYTFNVHYDDCDPPWIFCRHKDTLPSKDEVIMTWGRIPIAMREMVRHIGIWPTIIGGAAVTQMGAVSDMNYASNVFKLNNVVHESGHAVDKNLRFAELKSGISDTQRWRDQPGKDGYVVTPYSRRSWIENFAELMPYYMYNTIVPGGLDYLFQQRWHAVDNQLNLMREMVGDAVRPRSKIKCDRRFDNSPAVLKSNSFRLASGAQDLPLPDTSIAGKYNVTIMSGPPGESLEVADTF